ncbi:FtsX-like permease family protein [Auraticoccus monumenti]|uniref:Putative ABC transport system permease protein n=1 Tax=Auraticoccus monumenti TaxID=675864 RepID=A0A1G6TRQ0_9ACTN|nr:FtsX-like permease family protein [Auraticoccus monumenti]SDD31709.1 putative ABC transport system permease protein [Auraticoccus monumenti]
MTALRLSLAELRHHPRRVLAIVVAVAISVAFMVASFSVVQTEYGAVGAQLARQYADSDLVVENPGVGTDSLQQAVTEVPGVAVAEPSWMAGSLVSAGERSTRAWVMSMAAEPRLQQADLGQGRWPTTAEEVALDPGTAEALGVGVGDALELTAVTGEGQAPAQVVGVAAPTPGLLTGTYPTVYAAPAWFTSPALSPEEELFVGELLVLVEPGTDPASLVVPLTQAVAGVPDAVVTEGATVQTTPEKAAAMSESLAGDASVITVLLLVFASIAMLVGALIIANTFSILVVQRRRRIGLLRAVGATSAQLRAGMLAEAAVTGLVGAVLGVLLGLGVTLAVAGWSGSLTYGLRLDPVALGGSALAGLLVTVLAATAAVARAARISPMEALRPVAAAAQQRRTTVIRVVVCSALAVVGVLLAVLSLPVGSAAVGLSGELVLVVAIAAGATLSLAVLGAAPLYVPALLRGLGVLTGRLGPVGRIASAGLARNPARAAATCVALMLTVGLTVTLQTGAATAQRTLLGDIQERFPVDVSLADTQGTDLDPGLVTRLTSVEGVTGSLTTSAVSVRAETDQGFSTYGTAFGVDPVAADAFLPEPLSGLDDRTAVLSPADGLAPGQQVTVTAETYDDEGEVVSSRSETFTTVISHAAHQNVLLTPAAVSSLLGGGTNTAGLWLDVDPRADVQHVSTAVTSITEGSDRSLVEGGALVDVAAYTQALDTLVLIATALLGAAVLISLVGVGNTLGLSVIERARESALLRALGLQRSQLRTMLLLEAVSLAVVGGVVGVLAGSFLGWLGASSLMVVLEQEEVQLAVSWPQTLGVLAVAVVAAALASVLPGRRAASAAPVEALAAE